MRLNPDKMHSIFILLLGGFFFITLVDSAVLLDPTEQGLYKKADGVIILTGRNFDKYVYGQNHGLVVQFYNSYCGHCRAFAPKFKSFAADIALWKSVFQLGVVDCSIDENTAICRNFEVMAYPSLRYLHENYVKGNKNIGESLQPAESADSLKLQILSILQSEQSKGRMKSCPSLRTASYSSYIAALSDVPNDATYTFLIFESENSTVGPQVILDTTSYEHIRVKRVTDTSELTEVAGIRHFPGLVAVRNTLEATPLTPKNPNRQTLLLAINTFLKSKNYAFPNQNVQHLETPTEEPNDPKLVAGDVVYYPDLEKTLKKILHVEISKYKNLSGEPLQALFNFLDVLIKSFPFRNNLKEYIIDLKNKLVIKKEWDGLELDDLVKRLEVQHHPVYSPNLEYVGCQGSQPQYRGYTCGLWTLFHTLTVNAAQKPGVEGPNVLRAMHGYVKHFFGCTECAEHFLAMAANNRLFDVKENNKAVLWLWISHNEVNLRLAGDPTEDPVYPKIQYPSVKRCPECRLARGAWNLPAVYQYLQRVYSNIQSSPSSVASRSAPSPFSNLDLGMLSILYILSFAILILVIKLFLTKRFYRKRVYKHDGWGKV